MALWGRCCWNLSFAFAATCKFLLGLCVCVSTLCMFFLCLHCVFVEASCGCLGKRILSAVVGNSAFRGQERLLIFVVLVAMANSWTGGCLACCRYCALFWPGACRCQEGSVSALTPGSSCVWVKLAGSVGSTGSFGSGAEGEERCSCSINIPDRLKSRD